MTHHKSKLKNVLLVEDDFILAMDAEDMLATDAVNVNVVDTVKKAFEVLNTSEIDCAIVDLQLVNHNSEPVIKKLKEQEIPFAIVTGADIKDVDRFSDGQTTVFRKPVDYSWVMRRLNLINNTI